jgi:hypothetical protein
VASVGVQVSEVGFENALNGARVVLEVLVAFAGVDVALFVPNVLLLIC